MPMYQSALSVYAPKYINCFDVDVLITTADLARYDASRVLCARTDLSEINLAAWQLNLA